MRVCYRIPSSLIEKPYSQRDIRTYDYIGNYQPKLTTPILSRDDELFSTPGLYKSGSISRGITVGSRQNLFVNSSLNLQLSGRLTDDLNIDAVITDQNIPFQPEGNTQQLRDFDNVFISIYNEKFKVTTGDIVLENPKDRGHFLKYYKNQQGFQVEFQDRIGDHWSSQSKASVALSKGLFATTKVDVIEGVQGPYRLRGPNGEEFIIILANSEKVYLDGKLLKRGFDKDYIIDYNLSELTFNPNILLTRFSRIRVDFEYTQQTFPRSNMLVSQRIQSDRMDFYFDYYREKDNENDPLTIQLDDSDLPGLQNVGDNLDNATISGVDSIRFSEDRILYKKIDTIVSGQQFDIYVRSVDPDSARFSISFSEVGPGFGNYILEVSTTNGRSYRWVAPQNGVPSGRFEPVIKIAVPNMRQMGVFGSRIKITEKLQFHQETAFSRQDKNLLSSIDDNDNTGMAWKGGFSLNKASLTFLEGYELNSQASFEYNSTNFLPIDRFRAIDFDRDWDYLFPQDSLAASERIIDFSTNVTKDINNSIEYNIVARHRKGAVKGIQQRLNLSQEFGPFFYNGSHFWMDNEVLDNNSSWIRTYSEAGLKNNTISTGYFFDLDHNIIKFEDSVVRSAMFYEENGVFLRSADSSKFFFNVLAAIRNDDIPEEGRLTPFTRSRRISVDLSPIRTSRHRINISGTYRGVDELLDSLDQGERTIQGRINSFNSFLQEHLKSDLNYSTSNSRELRREFIYTLVGTGQGTHTWRDEDGDGTQDLNEFYEALNPDERNYIKLFVPTNEYIEAFQTIYQHTVDIKMPSGWRSRKSVLEKISRFSFQSNWNIVIKNSSDELSNQFNPFSNFNDSTVLFGRRGIRHSIFYNRAQRGIGISVNRRSIRNKQLNQNGFELMKKESWDSNLRWNLLRDYQIDLNIAHGVQQNTSDFLVSRNFKVFEDRGKWKFNWLMTRKARMAFSYAIARKENRLSETGNDKSLIQELGSEFIWSEPKSGNVNMNIQFLHIDFEGSENTYIGYLLLDALQPGNNVKVNVNWQQNLRKGLQLTFQYFGRKSENTRLINSGSMQLTAYF